MTPPVLQDQAAEEALAACAATSLHGARLAAGRLGPGDFYDPRCAAILTAATGVPDGPDRELLVATAADVDPHLIARWCATAPVMWDTTGALAARVTAAAARRARVHELLAELEDLGVHSRLRVTA